MVHNVLKAATFAAEREHLLIAMRSGYAARMFELPDKLGAIKAAVNAFSDLDVHYALIGGLAVGIRSGVPRATLDVNFAVTSNTERTSLIGIMLGRGFRLIGEFAHSVNFEHTGGEPVQLAFDEGFDAMVERAEKIPFGDLQIPVSPAPRRALRNRPKPCGK